MQSKIAETFPLSPVQDHSWVRLRMCKTKTADADASLRGTVACLIVESDFGVVYEESPEETDHA